MERTTYGVGYHDPSSHRKTCTECASNKINSRNKEYIGSHVAEIEFFCEECGTVVDYWAYGFFAEKK